MSEAVRESEVRYRALAESLPDSVFILDANNRYVYVNPTAARWVGRSVNEIIGRHRRDFFPEEFVEQQNRMIRRVRQTGEMQMVEVKTPYGTGARLVEIRFVLLGTQPSPEALVMGLARDITSERFLQRQIVQISNEERERVGYELHDGLGQHLSGLAFFFKALDHDIRQILPEHAADLQKITDLLNDAVRQTRTLARQLAPVEIEAHGFDAALARFVRDASDLYRAEITLESGCEGMALPGYMSLALYRITQEAVHNSIRHGNASRIQVTTGVEPDRITLVVQDNGSGQTQTTPSGSGMGQRLMRYRAESLGGRLDISSAPSQGTRVECRIPFEAKEQSPATTAMQTGPAGESAI